MGESIVIPWAVIANCSVRHLGGERPVSNFRLYVNPFFLDTKEQRNGDNDFLS